MYTEGFVKLHRKLSRRRFSKSRKSFASSFIVLKVRMEETQSRSETETRSRSLAWSFWTTEKEDLEALGMTRAERERLV